MTIDFKDAHLPKSVIVYAVFIYVRYSVSYRELQEIMAERGEEVDHATLNRWVVDIHRRLLLGHKAVNDQSLAHGVLMRLI